MSAEELENYEAEVELSLYREYRDVVSQFSYVVETERRFYLANAVELIPHTQGTTSTMKCACPMHGCGTCIVRSGLSAMCESSPTRM